VFALQPQGGPAFAGMHAVPLFDIAQSKHCPPVAPHAEPASPPTHIPPEQQPPLHGAGPTHDFVQRDPLHAYPGGQSELRMHEHAKAPPDPAAHLGVVPPHATPHPPQLDAVVKATHALLQAMVPPVHVNVHVPPTHAGCALATVVLHSCSQLPQ
jgi:hypothetical protein